MPLQNQPTNCLLVVGFLVVEAGRDPGSGDNSRLQERVEEGKNQAQQASASDTSR